jgi:prepilin-type N-terminal cleavage/methylation domain-containing protein/prepilin-type processing-associated H-X9-DG protein
MRHWRRGFTLIELLVVIAIIAILAAMLMPALDAARRRAQMTTCISQLKQLSIPMFMYTNDSGGFLPGMYWRDPDGNDQKATGGYIRDANGDYVVLGHHIPDSHGTVHKVIPMAGVQNLFVPYGYLDMYLYCKDLGNQAMLDETVYPYTSTAQPLYGPAYDVVRHAKCPQYGVGGYVQANRTAQYAKDYYCPHLLRQDVLGPNHLLLGEQNARNRWAVGYGYDSLAPGDHPDAPYAANNVGFRHVGPSANFLFNDGHVENWDWKQWLADFKEMTHSVMGEPK